MKVAIINTPESVTQKAASAVKWSALMEVVARIASPIIFLVLALLLTPEDFGVVSTATIVISFSQLFWDAGLGKALVQTKEMIEKAANVVFWTNLILGIVTYVVLFLTAPWLAVFFNSPASMPVLRVLGLQVVIASLASVQSALFVRDFAFRQLFWVKLVTAFAPGFFAIPLAVLGYGVWALVAGSLAGSLLNVALLWAKSMWRPRLRFDLYPAQKLFGFGIWVILEGLGAWFFLWGDNLLVGKLIGIEGLGIYTIAWNISSIIFGLLLNPFLPVLYPTFSQLRNDVQTLMETFHKVNKATVSLALPTGTAMLLIGQELVPILFANKWNGLGFVLSIIGFTHGIAWLVGINAELYRALGRPDINTKLMFGTILYYLPAYLVTAPFGLEAFTIVRLGVDLVAIPIHVYLCMRMLDVSPFYLWYEGKLIVFATLAMALVIIGCKQAFILSANAVPRLVVFITLVIAGIVAYSGTLWLLDRPFICQMKTLLKRVALA